jgi:hypothetical protein
VKWIITNKYTTGCPAGGIPPNTGRHHAIPSSALEDDLVQYLIVYKKAQPVPAVMSIILDWMHCWGRSKDVEWYNHVVDWLHFLLFHGIHLSDKLVLRDCVEYRMRKMINQRGLNVNQIIAEWHTFFDEQYESRRATHFYDLASFSFHWFENTVLIPTSPVNNGPAIVMSSP